MLRRAALAPLEAMLNDPSLRVNQSARTEAERVRRACLADVHLAGAVAVCERIRMGSHDVEGDLKRLSASLAAAREAGTDSALVSRALALEAKLVGEVDLADLVHEVESGITTCERVVETKATVDPTLPPAEGVEGWTPPVPNPDAFSTSDPPVVVAPIYTTA
jgi:hypothetical protein